MMNNWIPKNNILKSAIVIATVCVILYFIALFAVLREVGKVEDLYSSNESEFVKERKFEAIKNVAESNEETIKALRDFFVQKGDEVKFIERIEQTAREADVKYEMVSINVGTNPDDSLKEDINILINAEGYWKNIMLFVNRLEKMPFGVKIENINLDANVSGYWSGFIRLVVFREK